MTDATQAIADVAAELGLTMTAEFVPWSQSRNKGEKQPSLNWRITLHKGGRAFLATDYSAGCGHCPSYKQGRKTVDELATVKWECENGKRGTFHATMGRPGPHGSNKPILPELADVLSSLVMDAGALDNDGFESWANDLGYDTDSRKAETIYRACLETGLKLRNALGEDGLKRLREACADY